MNSEPIVSALPVPAPGPLPRRDVRFLIAFGVPLAFLVACGSGQMSPGTGGAAGGTTTGTGGAGAKGGGAGGGGHSGSGGGGMAGKPGTGGSSSGGVGGAASGGVGGGSGGAAGGSAGAGGGASGGAGGAASGGVGGAASGGVGGGAAGAAGGAGGAGGSVGGSTCATAVSGATCTSEGLTCGGSCTDMCQFCNLLRCVSGHWQQLESAPAPCFSCGDGKCQTLSQYCKTTEGGPVGSTPSHVCVAIPTACQSTRTCACLAQNSVSGTCTMGSAGELMTLLQVP
jgi:hypothetical protein